MERKKDPLICLINIVLQLIIWIVGIAVGAFLLMIFYAVVTGIFNGLSGSV